MITLVFLLFIYMIPIGCKITNFSLYLFVSFFLKITIINFWHAPSYLISGKPDSQYALYSLIFRLLHSVINREEHEKYPYNQSSHNRKYTKRSIVKARASFIGRVTWSWLRFASRCAGQRFKQRITFEAPLLAQHLP